MRMLLVKERGSLKPALIEIGKTAAEVLEAGKPVEIIVRNQSKSREQEKKYHAMIADIADTVKIDGQEFSPEVWKAKLVEDFDVQKERMGDPLRHTGQVVMSLDNRRAITIRPSTARFTVAEGSEFIEYLYQMGTELGARFSDPSLEYYEEVMQRHSR